MGICWLRSGSVAGMRPRSRILASGLALLARAFSEAQKVVQGISEGDNSVDEYRLTFEISYQLFVDG